MVELDEKKAEYARRGIGIAALSYDRVEVLNDFAARKGISYPLLSDPDSNVIRAFGILNETVQAGTPFYGVPWPGTFFVDAKGVVTARYFEKDYRERYTAGNILLKVTPPDSTGWAETKTKHLTLRHGASDQNVRGGDRIALALEVALPAKMHVYAPGVKGTYIPISWTLDPTAGVKAADAAYPASKMLHLAAIRETVPVYEGRFRVTRDITLPQQKELLALAGEGRTLTVKGAFKYQACDDKICYTPVTVPLTWTFRVEEHDPRRVPEALRRK